MHARQDAHLDVDRADLLGRAFVGPDALAQDALAHDLLLDIVKGHVQRLRIVLLAQRRDHLVPQGLHGRALFLLLERRSEDLVHPSADPARGGILDGRVRQDGGVFVLRLAQLGPHPLLQFDDGLHRLVPGAQRLQHQVFGQLVRARFDHQDRILGPRHAQVERGGVHLLHRRVHHERAIDKADAHRADRAFPRDVRDVDGRARRDDAEDVEVQFGIARQRGDDHLDLVQEPLGEQRPERPVDEAGSQDGLVRRPALAALEAAGDPPGRVQPLLKIDAEREEIRALARARRRDRAQQHRIARANGDGAGSQLRQCAGLDSDIAAANVGCVRILLHRKPWNLSPGRTRNCRGRRKQSASPNANTDDS